MSNQHRTADSCSLCHLRTVLYQMAHVTGNEHLTWSQHLALRQLQRVARWLLAQLLPVTRHHGTLCTECARYNRRRGLNVPPTERPFAMFHS